MSNLYSQTNTLGYGSKVLMLVHISPSEEDVCETICSLNFAKRARAIESKSNKEVPLVNLLKFVLNQVPQWKLFEDCLLHTCTVGIEAAKGEEDYGARGRH